MMLLFWASMLVIISAAIYVVVAPCVPGGMVSALFVGGAAVFAMAGMDQSPPNWVVGFTGCLAGAVLWAWPKWLWYRRSQRDEANIDRVLDRV